MLTPPAVTPLVLDSSNEALSAFAVASAVLGTKLVFNSSFTIYHRVKRQASLLCLYFQNGKWFQPKIQSCAEIRDCFVKHQPCMAGCGWLQPGRNFLST